MHGSVLRPVAKETGPLEFVLNKKNILIIVEEGAETVSFLKLLKIVFKSFCRTQAFHFFNFPHEIRRLSETISRETKIVSNDEK